MWTDGRVSTRCCVVAPFSHRVAQPLSFCRKGIASMLFGGIPVVSIFGRINGTKHSQKELVSKAVVFHLSDGVVGAAAHYALALQLADVI